MQSLNGLHGRRSSGKTTVMLKTIAQAQKIYSDQQVVLVDAELTFDPVWATKLGVDVSNLIVAQPDSGEEAVDTCEAFMDHPAVSLVCLDSIGALVPMKEVEGDAENRYVGIHAALCTRLVRKVNMCISRASRVGRQVTFLYTNQDRSGIGKFSPNGDPISNPGGKAVEHFSSLQVKFKNKELLKKDSEGFDMLDINEHAFTIEKNKWCAGIRQGEFQLLRSASPDGLLSEGDLDNAPSMLSIAKRFGVYSGGGRAWKLSFDDYEDTAGNMDEWITKVYEDEELFYKLRGYLIARHAEKLGMPDYLLEHIRGQY